MKDRTTEQFSHILSTQISFYMDAYYRVSIFYIMLISIFMCLNINSHAALEIEQFSPGIQELYLAPNDASLQITFNMQINEDTVNKDTVIIRGFNSGNTNDETISGDFSVNGNAITFTTQTNFFSGEKVEVTITQNVKSISNDQLESPFSWQFNITARNDSPGLRTRETAAATAKFVDHYQFGDDEISRDLAIGDVNGDGFLDLIVGNWSNNILYINDGSGVLKVSHVFALNDNTYAVELGDVNGDSHLDLVVGNFREKNLIYFNDGKGNFENNEANTIFEFEEEDRTTSIALGDITGDGNLDVLFGNFRQKNVLYANQGNKTFNKLTEFEDADNTRSIVLGDVNRDGRLDLITGNMNQKNSIFFNQGMGNFSKNQELSSVDSTTSVELSDINGDGHLDLVIGNWAKNSFYINNGSGSFINQREFITEDLTSSIKLGDVNGDNFPDLLVGNIDNNLLYYNNQEGNFLPPIEFDFSNNTNAVALGDLDKDNSLDLVFGNSLQQNLVYLNAVFVDVIDVFPNKDELFLSTIDTQIEVLFDKEIDETTVNKNTFSVRGFKQGSKIGNTILGDFSVVGNKVIFTPGRNYFPGELVEVSMTWGLKSLDFGRLKTPYTWRFHTESSEFSPFFRTKERPGVLSEFVPPIPFGIEDDTTSLSLGDINGDGFPDLVVGNTGSNQLYIADGSGDFLNPVVIQSSIDSTSDLIVADMNGDQFLDIIEGNLGHNSLLFNDGLGNFNSMIHFGAANNTKALAVGDINGDGHLDIIVGNQAEQNIIHFNDGDGNFTNSSRFKTADSTQSLALGDINNDGLLDLVFGNNGQNLLYINNGRDLTNNVITLPGNNHTQSIVIHDMNGDGFQDIISGNTTENTLLLNDGIGNFKNHLQFDGINNTQSISIGDINGDNHPDMVVGNINHISMYINDGSAAFQDFTFPNVDNISFDISSLTLGDIDDDQSLDLIVGNRNNKNNIIYYNKIVSRIVSIHPGLSEKYLADATTTIEVVFDKEIDENSVNSNSFIVQSSLSGLKQDETSLTYSVEDQKVTFQSSVPFLPGEKVTVTITKSIQALDGGRLIKPFTWEFLINPRKNSPVKFLISENFNVADNTTSIAAGDLNGDGFVDLAAGNNGEDLLYFNNKNGFFFAPVPLGANHNTETIAITDINSDGHLDIAAGSSSSIRFYLNDSNGIFDVSQNIDSIGSAFALGDINGDGFTDLIAKSITSTHLSLVLSLNNGAGIFNSFETILTVSLDPPTEDRPFQDINSIVLRDMNSDGFRDIIAGNNGRNAVLFNDGKGRFLRQILFDNIDNTLSLSLGDVNQDGHIDLFVGNANNERNLQYVNDGLGGFTLHNAFFKENSSTVHLADINGDEALDVIFGNASQNNSLLLNINDGTGNFNSPILFNELENTSTITSADIDGDQSLDIIFGNNGGQNIINFNTELVKIVNTFPAANEIFMASNSSKIEITFDKSIAEDTVSQNTFSIRRSQSGLKSGITIPGNYSVNEDTVTFTPNFNFLPNEEIEVTLSTGIKSTDLGRMEKPHTWRFRTSIREVNTPKYVVSTPFGNNNSSNSMVIGDLNGDSRLDIIVGNRNENNIVYLNDGNRNFRNHVELPTPNITRSMELSDVNKDGHLDLIVGTEGNILVYVNNGDATFKRPIVIDEEITNTSLAVGDIDGDTDADIIAGNTGQNTIYFNQGDGTFDAPIILDKADTTTSIALGDINNDGHLDIVVGNLSEDSLSYINNGRGEFSRTSIIDEFAANQTRSVSLGDVDNDADLDLILGNDGQKNSLYKNNGNGTFSISSLFRDADATNSTFLGDVDGDHFLDLIVGNNGKNILFINDGKGNFSSTLNTKEFLPENNTTTILLGDIDGDEFLDVIAANSNSQNIVYYHLGIAPVLELGSGVVTYTENNPPTFLFNNAVLTDEDSPNYNKGKLAVAFITNGDENDRLILSNNANLNIRTSGSNIIVNNVIIGSITGGITASKPLIITLNENAVRNTSETIIRNIAYVNSSDIPGTTPRTVSITVTDDNLQSFSIDKMITVISVNDPPVLTVPSSKIDVKQDENKIIEDITISDIDIHEKNPNANLLVSFSAASGTLTLGNTSGKTIEFRVPLAEITNLLTESKLQYRADFNFDGDDVIHIVVDDLGNTGNGGNKVTTASIPLNVRRTVRLIARPTNP